MKRSNVIELVFWLESQGIFNRSQGIKLGAQCLVAALLWEGESPIIEASVHRGLRSKVWTASFTGADGRQKWKSTGTPDYDKALQLAREWEVQARAQRERLGLSVQKRGIRVRASTAQSGTQLSQKEVALLLGMSERGVRAVEKRAFEKLRRHPLLKDLWRQYVSGGELEEGEWILTQEEIIALFDSCQTTRELYVIEKTLWLIGSFDSFAGNILED